VPGDWHGKSAAPCRCSSTGWKAARRSRSASDAPEIDGTVRIVGAGALKVGAFADVRITEAGAYDLEARLERQS